MYDLWNHFGASIRTAKTFSCRYVDSSLATRERQKQKSVWMDFNHGCCFNYLKIDELTIRPFVSKNSSGKHQSIVEDTRWFTRVILIQIHGIRIFLFVISRCQRVNVYLFPFSPSPFSLYYVVVSSYRFFFLFGCTIVPISPITNRKLDKGSLLDGSARSSWILHRRT